MEVEEVINETAELYATFFPEMRENWKDLKTMRKREAITEGIIPLGYKVEVTGELDVDLDHYVTTDIFSLEWKGEPFRVIICGTSGAGKSRLLLRLMYFLKNIGLSPIVLIDPKSEYFFIKNMDSILLPGEKPDVIPYKQFVPKFINSKRKDVTEFCLGLDVLSTEEAVAMYYGISGANRAMVVKALVGKAISENKGDISLSRLKETINNSDKFPQTKIAAITLLEDLFDNKKALTNKTTHNFIKIMMEGTCPIIQYEMKMGAMRKLISSYTSMFMNMFLSSMGEVAGNINHPLYYFKPLLCIDEARVIAPPISRPPSKDSLIEIFGMGRGIAISFLLTVRQLKELDSSIIDTATHIIYLGKLTTDIKYLLGITEPENVYLADNVCIYDKDSGDRIGAVFDLQTRNVDFFKPVMSPMDIRKTTSMG